MRYIFALTVLLVFGIESKVAFAAEDDVKVISVVGDVKAVSQEGSRSVTRGSRMQISETLETGPNSKAQIYFSDGTNVQIEENSKIQLNNYQYKKSDDDAVDVSLIDGGIRWFSGKNKKGSVLRTPVALTGLRGTYFLSVFKQATAGSNKPTQILGIYQNAGDMKNEGGKAILGDDENFHLAKAVDWKIAPEYLLEDLGENFDIFADEFQGGRLGKSELDELQDALGDVFDDIFDRFPTDPFGPGPFDGFIDFAYENYYNNCSCCH